MHHPANEVTQDASDSGQASSRTSVQSEKTHLEFIVLFIELVNFHFKWNFWEEFLSRNCRPRGRETEGEIIYCNQGYFTVILYWLGSCIDGSP